MAAVVEALVVRGIAQWPASAKHSLGPSVALESGLHLIALTDEVRRRVSRDDAPVVDGFDCLPAPIASLAAELSHHGPVAYLHWEFHGGDGFHEAIAWRGGEILAGPLFTATSPFEALTEAFLIRRPRTGPMAVSVVLSALGVVPADDRDEFATVGLDRYRWTEEWAAAAASD